MRPRLLALEDASPGRKDFVGYAQVLNAAWPLAIQITQFDRYRLSENADREREVVLMHTSIMRDNWPFGNGG